MQVWPQYGLMIKCVIKPQLSLAQESFGFRSFASAGFFSKIKSKISTIIFNYHAFDNR